MATKNDQVVTNREMAASAMNSGNLEWHEHKVGAIDRVTALALCDSLGRLLWGVKFANRAGDYRPAVADLAIRLARHREKGRKTIRGVNGIGFRVAATIAIEEWIMDQCPTCLGALEVPGHVGIEGAQLMVPCGTCHGTGKRVLTNASPVIELARRLVQEADTETGRRYAQLMRRW